MEDWSGAVDVARREGRDRPRVWLLMLGLVGLLLVGAAPVAAAPPGTVDRVVVVFKGATKAQERAAARRSAHAIAVRGLGREQFQLVRPQAGQSAGACCP